MKRTSQSKACADRVARHVVTLPKSGIRDFFELVNTMGGDVVSLGIGEPNFVTPQHIREAAISSLENGHTSYTSNLGMMELRQEICRYVAEHYNTTYDPVSECIVTVGVSEALDLAFRAILNPGDEVIHHEPCFVSYAPGIRLAHGVPVAVTTGPANGFALDPAAVRAAVTPKTRALLLNFPCNPTGATLDRATLTALADVAREHDLLVLSDEIYSELTYEGEHLSIASLPGMRERTIFLHGFSKAYAMTGFRIGYACGPAPLIDAMMKIHQYSMMSAPTTAQEAAIEALRQGWPEMIRMRDEYRARRDFIVRELNDMGLPCLLPRGAFYVFPDIRSTGLGSRDFAAHLLQEQKAALVPGSAFGPCGEGFVRCSYAAAMSKIVVAMDRLRLFLANR
jgi:aminotransferase